MNAKEELLEIVQKNNLQILQINCWFENDTDLPCNQPIKTLKQLDYEYEDWSSNQILFGEVYCVDKNTGRLVWLSRMSINGDEWWRINRIPEFYLNNIEYRRVTSSKTIICDKKQALSFYEHLLDLVEKERMSKNFSEWCELEREYITLIGEKHFTEHFKNK